MSVGFLAIRTIEPDRGRSGSARAKHGTLRLHRIDAVGRAATQRGIAFRIT